MPLSDQLSELSAQAKKTEDVVTAAQTKNRDALRQQREQLKSKISDGKARTEAEAAAVQDKAQSWWDNTRSAIDTRFAQLREERDEHREERVATIS